MERELDSKVFMIDDYADKSNMEEHIKKYIRKLKNEYPTAVVTKEFYKGKNILVRATHVETKNLQINKEKLKEKERDDWYIRQRGER